MVALLLAIALDETPKTALQPYDTASAQRCAPLVKAVRAEFGFDVRVLPARKLPKAAFYAPRQRYRADKLLVDLNNVAGYDHVIGITAKDISVTHEKVKDWGVFGYGELPGKACVVSTYRLGGRGLDRKERLRRVVLHEVGHTIGRVHCPDRKCLMADAEGSIRSVDAASNFCKKCRPTRGSASK